MKEKKIGSTHVRLLQGDIKTCEVDAVINVSGKNLLTEAQPPSEEIEDPKEDIALEKVDDPNDELKAEHIMNTPSVSTTATAGALKIRKTMRSILEEAQAKKLKSLALPAIGSGINRYPLERCAEILLDELAKSVSSEDNSIEKVIFVLENQKSYRVFEQVLEAFEMEEDDD